MESKGNPKEFHSEAKGNLKETPLESKRIEEHLQDNKEKSRGPPLVFLREFDNRFEEIPL